MLEGVDAAGVKRWRCDRCGKVSAWTDSWWWFGSLKDDLPDTKQFCSDRCRETSGLAGEIIDARKGRR